MILSLPEIANILRKAVSLDCYGIGEGERETDHEIRECVRCWSIPTPLEDFLRWEKVISQTGWPEGIGDVTRTTEEIMREHCAKHNIPIPTRVGPSTGIAVAYNPLIIRPL